MKRNLLLLILALSVSHITLGQKSLTIHPTKDAALLYTTNPARSYYQTTNYGSTTLQRAMEWTSSGYPLKINSLLDFDFSDLPDDVYIVSATLNLNGTGGHRTNLTEGSSTYKSDSSYLRRILTNWGESTITYYKAFDEDSIVTTSVNQVSLHNSSTRSEDYTPDITYLVRDMLRYPTQSYGLYHELVTPIKYTEMQFASSDYTTDTTDRPSLDLIYYELDTYQIGSGTSVSPSGPTAKITPFATRYEDSKHQYIFTVDELLAAGMSPGVIHSLSFDVVSANIAMDDLNISIGHTTKSSFSSYSFVSGLVNVYSDDYSPTTGWNEFVFDQNDFSWDGESNIVVEVCFNNEVMDYEFNSTVRYSTLTSKRTASDYGYYSEGCGYSSASFQDYQRPNIKFSAIDYTIDYSEPDSISSYSRSLTNTQNYTRVVTAQQEGYLSSLLNETNPYKISEAISYTDGIGRSIQSASIASNPSGKDIVQFTEYDNMGRSPKGYMPYVDTKTTLGKYRDSTLIYQPDFYDGSEDYGLSLSNVDTTSYPFATPVFDDTPGSQVLEQGSTGGPWQPGSSFDSNGHSNGNTLKTRWETNSEEVFKWELESNGKVSASDILIDMYREEQLMIRITEDENGKISKAYYTKEGLLLSTERYDGATTIETVYVYDDMNRLRVVVPPEGMELASYEYGLAQYEITVAELDLFAYKYTYDKKGRLIEKKLPGVEPVYYIYDNRDRLVLSQDGNLRQNNNWTFIKYDEVNRPVLSGIVSENYSNTVMQDTVDWYTGDKLFEEWSSSGTHLYTNRAYPDISTATVYAVNYYDDYEFTSDFSQDTLFDYHQLNSNYDASPDYRVYTKPTGGKVKMIGADYWLQSAIYYDKYGRVVSTVRDLYPDGYEISNIKYKFNGQVEQSTLMHTPDDFDITLITQRYEYDHRGRVLEHYHQIDSQDEVLLQAYTYNELGQLIEKNIFCPDSAEFLQSIDYEYNIRGWLKSINQGMPTGGDKDLFTQELRYEDPGNFNSDTLYNGMITANIWWQANNDTISAYGYQYDDLYQLEEADFHVKDGSWTDSDIYNVNNLNYDKNGNIESVVRYGEDGTIDFLNYDYTGNQLNAVGDLATDDLGRGDFYDGTNGYAATEYTYDDNGNMDSDDNKGISSITYNFLNLPDTIDFSGGDKIIYVYDATGTRWKTVIEESGSATDSTIYMGGFVYNNDTLSFARTGTGRMVPDGSDYRYDHFITDHLGSTRIVFTDLDDDNDADILQETHYYPFGLEMTGRSYLSGQDNQYLYTGKSIDEQQGLDWYAHGARYYDPQLALWHSSDPLSELYTSFSPYNYVVNNPINYIDPNGMTYNKPSDWEREQRDGEGAYYNWELANKMAGMTGSQIFGTARGPSYYEYQAWEATAKGNPIYGDGADDFLYWWKTGRYEDLDWEAGLEYAYDFAGSSTGFDYMSISSSGVSKGYSLFKQAEYELAFHETIMNSNGAGYGMSGPKKIFQFYLKSLAFHLRNSVLIAPRIPNPFYKADAVMFDVGFTFAGSESDVGFILMLNGPLKGQAKTFTELGGGLGTDIGFSSEMARIDYVNGGNIENFTFSDLDGSRTKFYAGISPGGLSIAFARPDAGGLVVATAITAGIWGDALWGPAYGGTNKGEVYIPGIN